MNDHRDLTERGEARKQLTISRTVAVILGIFLAVSGIVIALILPGMLSDDNGHIMKEPEGELDVILESTVDEMDMNSTIHHDVPLSSALWILSSNDGVDRSMLNEFVNDLVDWFFPGWTGFTLTMSEKGGIGAALSISYGQETDPIGFSDERYIISETNEGGDSFYTVSLDVRWEVGS